MKSEPIENIRKKFKNEWLLISVAEVDPVSNVPLTGTLIAHGENRGDIHESSKNFKGLAYIVYSEDWPDDMAACFLS